MSWITRSTKWVRLAKCTWSCSNCFSSCPEGVYIWRKKAWSVKSKLSQPRKKGWRPYDGWWPSLSSHFPASPLPAIHHHGDGVAMHRNCYIFLVIGLVTWKCQPRYDVRHIQVIFFRVSMKPFWHFQSWDAICQFSSQTITFSSLCGPLLFPRYTFRDP